MTKEFESTVKSVTPDLWQVEQVVILDWHDGPRTGFCKMAYPAVCFYFEALADAYSEDDTDDHLYELSFCLPQTVDKVIEIFAKGEIVNKPIWIPSGKIVLQIQDEETLKEMVSNASPSSIIIQSRNMVNFLRCWVKARRVSLISAGD